MSKQTRNWKEDKRRRNAEDLNPYAKKKKKNEHEEEFDDSFLDDENLRPKKKQH